MARKPRGQGRPPGAPAAPQHSQPPRPQGGGGWGPLRDAVRRDIEQASAALAFAAALHERLESQRRLFADFPRVMEQLRSGALERVATALGRLFEGKEQFDLTRFLRDLPLALGQLAAAEVARKGVPREPSSPDLAQVAAAERGPAADQSPAAATPAAGTTPEERDTPAPQTPGTDAVSEPAGLHPAPAGEVASTATDAPAASATPPATSRPASALPGTEGSTPASALSVDAAGTGAPGSGAAPSPVPNGKAEAGNGGGPPEPPSPRLELRSRLLAAAPQLGRAVVTYRRTAATVRRAASPRRAPGPWRSDREVLEEARLAIDFARQLFDAYAEAWADQPTQPGSAESMSAETDRFLAWTQLARYMEVAAPRSQPPPAAAEKKLDEGADKQPVTQGSAGAGAPPAEAEPAHGA